MQVRDDLKDISNTINHLMLISNYLLDKNREWAKWYNNNCILTRFYDTNDGEVVKAGEYLYSEGIDLAYSLALLLQDINSIECCPKLKDYINKIFPTGLDYK